MDQTTSGSDLYITGVLSMPRTQRKNITSFVVCDIGVHFGRDCPAAENWGNSRRRSIPFGKIEYFGFKYLFGYLILYSSHCFRYQINTRPFAFYIQKIDFLIKVYI
jgi:hypothetical protein